MVKAGAVAVRSGESVVGIYALRTDAEFFERGLLGGEVLLVSAATGAADGDRHHGDKCTTKIPH